MIRSLCMAVLLSSMVAQAQNDTVRFADATQERALVDEYLASYTTEVRPLVLEIKLLKRLFDSYDRIVYRQTLVYLESFAAQQPEAVLALSDSIQTYWDSHYLHSYLSKSGAEYSKLKFLAALGLATGGIGLLKNPLAAFSTLRHLNMLLPVAGGVGTYYAVNFFQPSPDIPLEPQEILSFAQGKSYFSYQQKRNDYLYRLFAVGGGIGTGQFVFNTLTKNSDQVYKILKPKLKPIYLKGALGALLGYFAIQHGSYYLLRTVAIKQKETHFKNSLQDLYDALSAGDTAETIETAQQLTAAATQLVTLSEMKHLHAMVKFEQELSKPAAKQAGSDVGVREKIEEVAAQLSNSLKIKANEYHMPEQSSRAAKAELDKGKLQHGIALLWQVAMTFKVLSEDSQFAFLQHFYHKTLAKFNNMLLMYDNFGKIVEHNRLRQLKFTPEDLRTALNVYLDYYRADSEQSAILAQLPDDNSKEVLTSTRGFARFLAQEIARLKNVKEFNYVILHILDLYQHQAQHREALAVLVQDIEEQAEIHDSYYDSVWAEGIKGAMAGTFALMGAAGLTNLWQKLGTANNKRPWRGLAKLLSFENGKQWNFAGLPTNLKALKRLGMVGVAGAGAGVLAHYLRRLRTHKLPPETALLDIQKLVALELAYQACQLAHDIEVSTKDEDTLQTFNVEQIEAERELYTALATRFKSLATQVNHLHNSAPSLRIKHALDAQLAARVMPTKTAACSTQEVAAVSITPLTEDLRHAAENLRRRKSMLDMIDRQRLLQELGG